MTATIYQFPKHRIHRSVDKPAPTDYEHFIFTGFDGSQCIVPVHHLKEVATGQRKITEFEDQVVRRLVFEWLYKMGVRE